MAHMIGDNILPSLVMEAQDRDEANNVFPCKAAKAYIQTSGNRDNKMSACRSEMCDRTYEMCCDIQQHSEDDAMHSAWHGTNRTARHPPHCS